MENELRFVRTSMLSIKRRRIQRWVKCHKVFWNWMAKTQTMRKQKFFQRTAQTDLLKLAKSNLSFCAASRCRQTNIFRKLQNRPTVIWLRIELAKVTSTRSISNRAIKAQLRLVCRQIAVLARKCTVLCTAWCVCVLFKITTEGNDSAGYCTPAGDHRLDEIHRTRRGNSRDGCELLSVSFWVFISSYLPIIITYSTSRSFSSSNHNNRRRVERRELAGG